jgi:hypothetical protein
MMNIDLALKEAKLLDAKPVQGDLGLPEGRIIAKADPARSVLLYRMTTAGRGHMPYVGAELVDDRGVLLVRDWIASIVAFVGRYRPSSHARWRIPCSRSQILRSDVPNARSIPDGRSIVPGRSTPEPKSNSPVWNMTT